MVRDKELEEFSEIIDQKLKEYNLLPEKPQDESDLNRYMVETLKIKIPVLRKLFSEFLGIENFEKKDLMVIGSKIPELAHAALKDKVKFYSILESFNHN